jgi:N12 class adenine-specific DNA methylase
LTQPALPPLAATSEYGTPRANGTSLLELALNMKSPTIYDTVINNGRSAAATFAGDVKKDALLSKLLKHD